MSLKPEDRYKSVKQVIEAIANVDFGNDTPCFAASKKILLIENSLREMDIILLLGEIHL